MKKARQSLQDAQQKRGKIEARIDMATQARADALTKMDDLGVSLEDAPATAAALEAEALAKIKQASALIEETGL